MEHYDYRAIVWDHMQSYNVCTVQDHGYQIAIEQDQVMHFVRKVPVMVVDSDLVTELLFNQGIYAYVDSQSTTEVVYKDLVITPNHRGGYILSSTTSGAPRHRYSLTLFCANNRRHLHGTRQGFAC
jgi:hypothetical protein